MTKIVGLTGLKGSGKDTAAKVLKAAGFEEVKMAGGLKEMIRAFLYYQSVPSETVERMIEGDLKEVPTKYLGDKTPREFMQLLGTEFGRNLINPAIWVNAFVNRAASLDRVVCTDVRFPNETDAVYGAGGDVYRIERDTDVNTYSLHESEAHIPNLKVSGIIDNHGSVEELQQEMITRFLPGESLESLAEKLAETTLRFQLTIDLDVKPEWFDEYHTDGKVLTPLEMTKAEIFHFENVDSSVLASSVMNGEFTVTGRPL